MDVEGSNGDVGDGTKAESIRKVMVAGVVALDVVFYYYELNYLW